MNNSLWIGKEVTYYQFDKLRSRPVRKIKAEIKKIGSASRVAIEYKTDAGVVMRWVNVDHLDADSASE